MDLDEAADQLYALPPAELDSFADRRTELVAQARTAGDRPLASAIGKLRKPVLAAALVNLLVRSQPAVLAELTELAGALRDAHRHLRGPELRALSERRQQVLGRLVGLARKGAGRPVGDSVLDQLRATFEAAIADEAAEQAVLSGRLTAALSYSGFGAVDISDAVAVPRRLAAVPDLVESGQPTVEAEPAGQGRAERAVARAERLHDEALDGLDAAVEQLAAARATAAEIADRIDRLRAELAEAGKQADRAATATGTAEREHRRAARAVERAEQALAKARAERG